MTTHRAQLQEDTNFWLLRMLQASPDLDQREIAHQSGGSTPGVADEVNALYNSIIAAREAPI